VALRESADMRLDIVRGAAVTISETDAHGLQVVPWRPSLERELSGPDFVRRSSADGQFAAAGPAQRTSLTHCWQRITTRDQLAPNRIQLEPSGYTAAPSRGKFSYRLGGQQTGGSHGYIRCACHVQRAGH